MSKHYASKVIEIALSEVGYHEKASNSQLNSKTANSGSANYNKFAAFIDKHYPEFYNLSKNGYDWCDIFNDYCHIKASDMETARKALYQPYESCGAGCPYSAGYYRQNGAFINRGAGMPKPGDQIFFGTPGDEYHTGIVVKVLGDKVYTVEGNSGEKVSEHCYYLTDSSIAGYGRPKYDKEVTTVELKENGAIYKYAYKDVLGGSSKLLKSLKTGAKVTWLKDDGYGWSKVRSGTVEGWIMNRHLKKSGLSKFKGYILTKDKKATAIEKKKAAGTKTLKKGVKYTLICTIERGKYKGKNYIAVGAARYYI